MKQRGRKLRGLFAGLILALSSCGNELNGRWVVDEPATTKSCVDALSADQQHSTEESGEASVQQMMQGLTQKMCRGLAATIVSSVEIDGSDMLLISADASREREKCTIDLKKLEFVCDANRNGGQAGFLRILNNQLVWEFPPQPEQPAFQVFFSKLYD
jgi:hypothetical protein